jgi:RNA polymerase sigma factor for flagellar operon FliA
MNADRETTIRDLFPLVRTLARRLHRVVGIADLDDLIGDGSIGLINAVDRFDAERGPQLEAYARRMIVGAMLNGLRRRDPVSERTRRTLRKADARRYELAQQLGTMPSLSELERNDPGLQRARAAAHRYLALSLDAPMPGGVDVLVDWESEPSALAVRRAKTRALQEAIALLPERQRRILALHYGDDSISLHAIGRRLSISPQRISQLHLSALARLRKTLPAP